jgi:Flp pilus assembly pilin Flp
MTFDEPGNVQELASPQGLIQKFLRDECGATSVVDFLLMGALVGLGCLVGLATIRDHIVMQFNDVALALESLNQSYSVTINGTTHQFSDSSAPVSTLTPTIALEE